MSADSEGVVMLAVGAVPLLAFVVALWCLYPDACRTCHHRPGDHEAGTGPCHSELFDIDATEPNGKQCDCSTYKARRTRE
ncbi:hypothetical protein GCM10010302_42500 [Streptomyces polychromogenes]|uniref:Uncharacterized protein n=1 Tax=Streptomyces polychromogenes TaxID=67342 RepID=A0ABP3F6I9_9ACTN